MQVNTYTQMNLPWSFKWDGTVVGFFFFFFLFVFLISL